MNSNNFINELIKDAEESYNSFSDEIPFPCVTTLKSNVKNYNIENLKEVAKSKGYIFTDMLNAPKPLDMFPESHKQERFILYKEIV